MRQRASSPRSASGGGCRNRRPKVWNRARNPCVLTRTLRSVETERELDNEQQNRQSLLRQQTALARFGEMALRSDDLEEILTEACSLVGEALGTDLAKVVELEPGGDTLLVRAGVGWNSGVVGQARVQVGDHTSEAHALKTGQPMISPDVAEETRFEYPPFLIQNGVRAVANVVIIGADGKPPFGLLQIDSRKPRHFDAVDTTFLTGYANLIAAAVSRLQAIGELRDREARLRASLARQEAALETGMLGFFEWDVPAAIIRCDRHFARFYGLEPAAASAGVPLAEMLQLVHPDDRASVHAGLEAALASGSDYGQELRAKRQGTGMRWMHVRGRCTERQDGLPIRYIGTAVDITASKQAEEALRRANEALERQVQERTRALVEANAKLRAEAEERELIEEALRQSQKMEALGQLTGGIAHDFNNMLQAIGSGLELMRRRAQQGRTREAADLVDSAQQTVTRAASLTNRLLAFARRQTLQPAPVLPDDLVRSIVELIQRVVGPGVRVEIEARDGAWTVLCDPNQLESVLLNLALNARDAMPEGGTLTVRTEDVTLSAARCCRAGRGQAWRVRRDRPLGHRRRHGRGDPAPSVRAVLHDQTHRPGDRPGPLASIRVRPPVGRTGPH